MRARNRFTRCPDHRLGQAAGNEPMVDADQAAALLRLPRYWFTTPMLRERKRIPHYVFGDLVRFRSDDLHRWAELQPQTLNPSQDAHAGAAHRDNK